MWYWSKTRLFQRIEHCLRRDKNLFLLDRKPRQNTRREPARSSWDATEVGDVSTGRHIWSRWLSARTKLPSKTEKRSNRGPSRCCRHCVGDICVSCVRRVKQWNYSETGPREAARLRPSRRPNRASCVSGNTCERKTALQWKRGKSERISGHYVKQKAHGGSSGSSGRK